MGTFCNSTKKPGQDGDLAQQHKAMTMPLPKPGLSNSDLATSVILNPFINDCIHREYNHVKYYHVLYANLAIIISLALQCKEGKT